MSRGVQKKLARGFTSDVFVDGDAVWVRVKDSMSTIYFNRSADLGRATRLGTLLEFRPLNIDRIAN